MDNSAALLEISSFKMTKMTPVSKITFFGKDINPKIIFKNYRLLFESLDQVIAILDSIPGSSVLVINETNMNAKTSDIISYYQV